MKQYHLPFLFYFLSGIASAQDNSKDSLLKVLSTQKEDTAKVSTLNRLSATLRRQYNVADAIQYAGEAVVLSNKLGFKTGKARAYMEHGFAFTMQQKHSEALKAYDSAYQNFVQAGNKAGIASSLLYKGQAHHSEKNYPAALKSYNDALLQYDEIKNQQGVAECFRWMGHSKLSQENSAVALKYYYKSLKIYEQLGDKQNVASCLGSIGWAHQMQADFVEALDYLKRSLTMWEELGNPVEIVRLSNMVGSEYFVLNNHEKALEKHLYALQIAKSLHSPPWVLSMTLPRLGGDYEALAEKAKRAGNELKAQEMYGEAMQDYSEALKLHQRNSDKQGMADVYWHFGSIHTKLKKYELARTYFEKALELYKETSFRPFIGLTFESLSKLDSTEGNFQRAYENYKLAYIYRDSLFNDESVRKAAKAKIQYEFDKKEDSLKLQQLLVNEKLTQQQLLAVQQQQKIEIEAASLKLSNQQKELNRLAYTKAEASLQAEQSKRKQKEEQLLVVEKEKALEQANLKLKITELSLKEQEVQAGIMERNIFVVGAVAIIILGIAFYRNRANRQRVANLQEKQKMRTQIAGDLHDDIGSELTGISFCTEMVKMQLGGEKDEVKKMLDTIGNNARTIVNTMSDIVWVINPENDIAENLIRRMHSHGVDLCNKRNIDCEFRVDSENDDLPLNMHQRKNLYLIYKEAMHNAVKYAGCSKIHISLIQNDHQLNLSVVDNGKGFDSTKPTQGNGLANMQRRAEEIDATFNLESFPGSGTSISLKLKIT
jgi:signal transduction histidine kinase